ncbi:hypothetical protein [Tropicimonas sediminicola]|uniref:Uncharacterized protein n=1 Tax=Tropicimonas sediminicola TaxID=1031541 RepID=A0A239FV34_9RHOB|nr:hypothetical protein [Tropicimonas sediminicola]SNS60711.1 hypothetical protein SAMN05421757_102847 [Tropicimonas sediminicola]
MTSDTQISEEFRVERDWPRTVGLIAIGLLLMAVSAYGVQMEVDGYRDRRFHRDSFVILPLASFLLCIAIWRLLVPFGAPLRIRRSGLIDLRMNRAEIPWAAVRNCVRRGDFVVLTLRPGFSKTYTVPVEQKLVKAMHKRVGPNHLMIATWCLDISSTDLNDVIDRYRSAGKT